MVSNWYAIMQVPAEFKEVLDNTVVAAVSQHAPLVSFYLCSYVASLNAGVDIHMFLDLSYRRRILKESINQVPSACRI